MTANGPLKVRRHFPRPDAALVEAFAEIPTGPIIDAMGRSGALDFGIRPLTVETSFVGVALTVSTIARDNLAPYVAIGLARAGDVLVVTNGASTDASVLGDLALGMARNAGVRGVVTDGLVRDIDGIERLGIPVFARGLTPNSPFKNGPGTIGEPIAIGGIGVAAGDIVRGDRDGVVVVPQARAAEVLEACRGVLAKEAAVEAAIRAGATAPDWLAGIMDSDAVHWLD